MRRDHDHNSRAVTTRVPSDQLSSYLERFTRDFLKDLRFPRNVDVEVVTLEWGDQFPFMGARLIGMTYDAHEDAVEVAFSSGDHRVDHPLEVWVVEEPDGFLSALEFVLGDGTREILRVQRVGLVRTTRSRNSQTRQ